MKKFLSGFSDYLNHKKVPYAVLGSSFEREDQGNDVDFCVADIVKFQRALKEFCTIQNAAIVSKSMHATGIRYNVSLMTTPITLFPGPDVLFFPTWHIKGDLGLSYSTLLANRSLNEDGYYVPSPDDAFLFYLVRRIDKKSIDKGQGDYLSQLWEQESELIFTRLSQLICSESVEMVVSAAQKNNWLVLEKNIDSLYIELLAKKTFFSKRFFWMLKRTYQRVLFPTGLFVAFLGPDGSGKSSVISNITQDLKPIFGKISYTHLNPKIGRKKDNINLPVLNPHDKKTRGLLASLVKLLYFFCDYNFGYLLRIRPMLIQSTLVVFDRYYHDLLVDSKRYRYGGPMWIARWVGKFVPSPDLIILLNAPPDVLQARKQEVPMPETIRQSKAYLSLVQNMPNGVVIDASQPLEKVVLDVNRVLLDFLAKKTEERFGI